MTKNTLLLPRRTPIPASLSRASDGFWSRLKGLFIACCVFLCGGFAHAVENVYVSPNVLTVGGPNGFTYADDSYSGTLPIGFTFRYGGVNYTQCHMSTNGVLFFTNRNTEYDNEPLNGWPTTNNLHGVYALWDDLYVGSSGNPAASTAIYYTVGAPGSRKFIMQWTNWYSYNETYEVGTFNVVLHEGTNKVDIYYRNMLGVSALRGFGASATIGLVSSGGYSNQYSHNAANATEGRLLTYTPTGNGENPYTLGVQQVTPATTAAIETYFLFSNTNPKQPVDLSASPGVPNLTSTTLNWDLGAAGVEPTTYTIRYSTSPTLATFTETAPFAPAGRPYVLSSLTQGMTYYWQAVSRVGSLYTTSTISSFIQTPNTVPVANPASYSTEVNNAYSGTLVATDADNTPTSSGLIYSITSNPATGAVSITNSSTGAFTYTPAQNTSGVITFGFKAFDGTAYSDEAIVTITVSSNTPPTVTLTGANPITLECYVDTYVEFNATAVDPEDGSIPVVITGTVDRTHVGTYTKTYTATDSDGVAVSVTRTINVVDTRSPVITIPTNILIPSVVPNPSGPTLSNPVFYSPTVTASDVATGNRPVTLSHPTGTRFPVGRTLVTVSASDPSGNSATRTFEVIVLEYQESPGVRFMDMVAFRGAAATGAPAGTIFNINRAFVNNRSDVIYDAVLTGAGANDNVVFYGPLNGAQAALAVKGAASGVGNFGAFSNLTLNHLGHAGFESLVGSTPAQFRSAGGAAAAVSAVKSGLAPTGTGEAFNTLYQPAMSSNGLLLTPSTLQLGSGAGVTISNDTLINTSGGGVIAREGAPTSVAGVNYGQLHPRVVASRANEKYAFAAFLETAVFDPDTNTGLFVGTLGGGAPDLVVREGDAANGVTGGRMFQFLGESVNSAGGIAFRASVTGGAAVTAANNDGIWTNAGAIGAPPVLVAREGAIVPVSPANRVSFSRFTTLHMQDDGSVVFFAFLQNATAVAVVNSNNDGSIWRWSAGRLTLLAREGELANNTAGARILNINGFDCNDVGGMVYDATLVPGVGDTTTATNQAVFLNRGNGLDPAPLLTMRRNDSFTVEGNEHSVAGIKISTSINSGGGTGGYGRAINDSGEVVFNLTLSGNKSGIFLLGSAPAN